jgi:hypothetical protein
VPKNSYEYYIIFSLFIQKPGRNNTRNPGQFDCASLKRFFSLIIFSGPSRCVARRFFSFSLYLYHWHAAHFEIRGKDQMERNIYKRKQNGRKPTGIFQYIYFVFKEMVACRRSPMVTFLYNARYLHLAFLATESRNAQWKKS